MNSYNKFSWCFEFSYQIFSLILQPFFLLTFYSILCVCNFTLHSTNQHFIFKMPRFFDNFYQLLAVECTQSLYYNSSYNVIPQKTGHANCSFCSTVVIRFAVEYLIKKESIRLYKHLLKHSVRQHNVQLHSFKKKPNANHIYIWLILPDNTNILVFDNNIRSNKNILARTEFCTKC